ncbi:MAG: hypothetical protein LBK59_06785 [Bifidobacteriaceae bacterium]|jgi:hypothetical protein|nr:hypothetical protein [Bifidobacteriaceae bacterium]
MVGRVRYRITAAGVCAALVAATLGPAAWSRSGTHSLLARLVDPTELSAQKVLTNVSSKNPYAKVRPTLELGVRVVKRVSYGLEGAGIWVLSDGTIQVDRRIPRNCIEEGDSLAFPQTSLPTGLTYVDVDRMLGVCRGSVLAAEAFVGDVPGQPGGAPPHGLAFTQLVDGAGGLVLFLSDGRVYLAGVCKPGARGGEACMGRAMITSNKVTQGVKTSHNEIALLNEDGMVDVYVISTHENINYDARSPVLDEDIPRTRIPELPPGVQYTAIGHDSGSMLGLARSDGTVTLLQDYRHPDWKLGPVLEKRIPKAPPGLYYVDMAIHRSSIMLLRNDGHVVGATVKAKKGAQPHPPVKVPSLAHGWVFTDVWPAPDGFYFGAAKIPSGQKVASAVAKLKGPARVARGARAVFTAKIATRATVKGQQVVARVDGKVVGKAKADKSGNVRVTINTAKLTKGKHTIKFKTSAKGKSAASKAATATLRIR